jgi:hypothetical protein
MSQILPIIFCREIGDDPEVGRLRSKSCPTVGGIFSRSAGKSFVNKIVDMLQ